VNPDCQDITALMEGLAAHQIHATNSARMLLDALQTYRMQFQNESAYKRAALKELRRMAISLPPYAPLINTMNRVLTALLSDRPLDTLFSEQLTQSTEAEQMMQQIASRLLAGKTLIATYTFSQTLSACLLSCHENGGRFAVTLTESRPNCDGVYTARMLRGAGIPCMVGLDADMGQLLGGADIALFGCEAVLPCGNVIGKVGQSAAARICAGRGIPVYIYAGLWKLLPPKLAGCEALISDAAYANDAADLTVRLYDVTCGNDITGIITEHGIVSPQAAGMFADQNVENEMQQMIERAVFTAHSSQNFEVAHGCKRNRAFAAREEGVRPGHNFL